MEQITDRAWDADVVGRNLPGDVRTLGDAVGSRPTLLVFLRHLG